MSWHLYTHLSEPWFFLYGCSGTASSYNGCEQVSCPSLRHDRNRMKPHSCVQCNTRIADLIIWLDILSVPSAYNSWDIWPSTQSFYCPRNNPTCSWAPFSVGDEVGKSLALCGSHYLSGCDVESTNNEEPVSAFLRWSDLVSPSSAVVGEPELECVAICVGEGISVGPWVGIGVTHSYLCLLGDIQELPRCSTVHNALCFYYK